MLLLVVSYKNNLNAGKASATISGKGNYKGSKKLSFAIAKSKNPLAFSAVSRTVRASAVAKKSQSVKGVSFRKEPQGKVAFNNASPAAVSRVTSVNKSTGAIAVKKGTKKGVYKVKVSVSAAGNGNYLPTVQQATVKITVK